MTMADKLEKYIRDRRQEFDSEEPRSRVWDRIRHELDDSRIVAINNFGWVWKVAAILLFGLSTYLLVERNIKTDPIVQSQTTENPFGEIEMHYTSIIEEKMIEIETKASEHPHLMKDFENDIGNLDFMYKELQAEFQQTNNERVVDAMINNLKLRIDILNYQLSIIERIKNKEHEEEHTQEGHST